MSIPARTLLAVLVAASPSVSAWQFTAATNLVVLNVRVTDDDGEHVSGLGKDAFQVLEDGRPKAISVFSREDAPVTAGLIVDSSTSMWALRDRLIAGAAAFARASHPEDELFAIAFNERRWPALSPAAPFTSNPDVLRQALVRVIQPRGRTGLFDAIGAGLQYAARGRHPRRALVLISDGGDNASAATFEDVTAATQASNVVIYGVALVDPVDREARPELIRKLARATGGEAFTPRSVEDLTAVLEHIAADLRLAYTIGIEAARTEPGAYHRLQVAAVRDGEALRVLTREGYREPAPREGSHAQP